MSEDIWGKVAWDAWVASWYEDDMPKPEPWEALPPFTRECWNAVAQAIREAARA